MKLFGDNVNKRPSVLLDKQQNVGARGVSVPLRTCVGCRRVVAQSELVRAVADDAGRLCFDRQRRKPGRGVYVHQQPSCIQAAMRGGFQRVLRRNLRASGDVLQEAMTAPAAHGMQHEFKRDNS